MEIRYSYSEMEEGEGRKNERKKGERKKERKKERKEGRKEVRFRVSPEGESGEIFYHTGESHIEGVLCCEERGETRL